jgi:hypothetical protein
MTAPLANVLRHIRKLVGRPATAGLTDGEILERFVSRHDEAAFEELLARHGPMVLGVCRQMLRNPHDAEDAFQATFLCFRDGAEQQDGSRFGNGSGFASIP